MSFESTSLSDTTDWGVRLGRILKPGDVVALNGPLGVGKTALVGGISQGMGIRGYAVASPTFVFAHIYEGQVPLYHIDLYRVEKEAELAQLGLEEMIGGEGVAAIEWFERFPSLWCGDRLEIAMEFGQNDKRKFQVQGIGARPMELARMLDSGAKGAAK